MNKNNALTFQGGSCRKLLLRFSWSEHLTQSIQKRKMYSLLYFLPLWNPRGHLPGRTPSRQWQDPTPFSKLGASHAFKVTWASHILHELIPLHCGSDLELISSPGISKGRRGLQRYTFGHTDIQKQLLSFHLTSQHCDANQATERQAREFHFSFWISQASEAPKTIIFYTPQPSGSIILEWQGTSAQEMSRWPWWMDGSMKSAMINWLRKFPAPDKH